MSHDSNTLLQNKVVTAVVALVLWLATAALGLWDILLTKEIAQTIYAWLSGDPGTYGPHYWNAVNIGNWVVLGMALVWIAVVIGGGEYHYKRVGQPRSWRLFAWTLGIELLIVFVALIT